MKQLLVDGVKGALIQETGIPEISRNQVLVKNSHSLVSTGTELHYLNKSINDNTRLRLGYCGVGEVKEVGADVDCVQTGQKVIAMGWGYAVHAEYLAMPKRLVHAVPTGMKLEKALLANIMATAVHAVDRAKLLQTDRVLVIGAGLVGQLVAEVARQTVSELIITDFDCERCKTNDSITGIDSKTFMSRVTEFEGAFTKAFICINGEADDWMNALVDLLNKRGNGVHRPRIIGVGRYSAKVNFSVELGNIDMVFSARCGEGYRNDEYVHGLIDLESLPGEHTVDENLKRSLDLISQSDMQLDYLISNRVSLSELPEFYGELEGQRQIMSAVVDYSHANVGIS